MIMYRSCYTDATIEPVEITRATQDNVWTPDGRRERTGLHTCYRDTWEEARKMLLDHEELGIRFSEARLKNMKAKLEKIKAYTNE